jgi:hypothetical protein
MVPEFRFGNDFISCEKTNGEYFWVGFLFGGELASEYEILSYLPIILSIPSFEERSQLDLEHP